MIKIVIKIQITIILLIFTICFATKVSCQNANNFLISNNNSAFLINLNTNAVTINTIYPTENLVTINSKNNILDVKISDSNIYLLSENYQDSKNLLIEKFDFNGNLLDSLLIYTTNTYNSCDYLILNDCIYFINKQNITEIIGLDFNGDLVFEKSFNEQIYSLYNCDNRVIAISQSSIYIIDKNDIFKHNLNEIKLPIYQLNNSYFVDNVGDIYNISTNITKIQSDKINFVAQNGTISSNYICLANAKTLYALSFDGNKLLTANFDKRIISVKAINDVVLVLTDDMCVYNVAESEFTQVNSQDNMQTSDFYINSDIYYIDTQNYLITQVESNTSLSKFSDNLSHNFDSLAIFDGQNLVSSGKICTGYIAKFVIDGQSNDFTIIVTGDINKNGVCNNADKDLLIDYLIGKANLDNIALISADIDLNNSINLQDLYLLRQIKQ